MVELIKANYPEIIRKVQVRRSEQEFYNKLKLDFPSEIAVLEKALDTTWQCSLILVDKAPLLRKPNLNANLVMANPKDRRLTSQTLLIYHATMFLRAARLLLLTGYPAPSMSCLRSTVESILNAHVCMQSDEQTMNWVKQGEIERKGFRFPRQIPESVARKIMKELGTQGVHANYPAFLVQAYYPGIAFSKENKREYEFLTLRIIYFSLFISNRFLAYLLKKKPFLKDQVHDAGEVLQDLKAKTEEVGARLKSEIDRLKLET